MAGRKGHHAPLSGEHHDGPARPCEAPECANHRRQRERERWQQRQGRGEAAQDRKPQPPGPSGASARAWLESMVLDADRVPAAADLLVVADTIDAAKAGGQLQFIAALARQAASLRAELTRSTDPDDDDGDQAATGQEVSSDSHSHTPTSPAAFDPAAI